MTIFKTKKNDEELIVDVNFNVHKFTNRQRPVEKEKVLFISLFAEFGCEVVGTMYCIPRIIEENPGLYVIVVGWYGRSYLYKHLADEFWETKEDVQWLRDYTLAFHHTSANLKRIEKQLSNYGTCVPSYLLGQFAVGNKCTNCMNVWGQTESVIECPRCSSIEIVKSLFGDVRGWKEKMVPIPKPCEEKMALAKTFLGKNPVAVTGRSRKVYGRNLPPEFYIELLKSLQKRGYDPIWLGERQSTMACPLEGVMDMSRREEARDLELTLAIVSQCKFTAQFWTASTRLAAIMGTPYILFETPDQIFGAGQEGYRLGLVTRGKKKLVLCNYLTVLNDVNAALKLFDNCVGEMENDKWQDVIGMVDDPDWVAKMRVEQIHRLGGI